MALFELHVCRNGNWRRLETFEDRNAAVSAAIGLERDRTYSAIKVVKEAYNESSRAFETKPIHKWSEETEKKARDREIDRNLERQRQNRHEIRQRAQANGPSWQARIKDALVVTATTVTAVAGVVVLMVALRGF